MVRRVFGFYLLRLLNGELRDLRSLSSCYYRFLVSSLPVTEMKACFAKVPENPEGASESPAAANEMSRVAKIEALADQMFALQREQQEADQEAAARGALARQQVSAAAIRQQQLQQQQTYAFGAVPGFNEY